MATCTLAHINQAAPDDVLTLLEGLYEHSPWIVQRALVQRPFASAAHFKYACAQVVDAATPDEQLALIRAHPELAGKAMVDHSLTAASTDDTVQAPSEAPSIPGISKRRNRLRLTLPSFTCEMPDTPVVNTSAMWTLALATAGVDPVASRKLVEVMP